MKGKIFIFIFIFCICLVQKLCADDDQGVSTSIAGYAINFTQATYTNPYTAYIPFSLTGRLITVEARIDSSRGNFFFDTGAERLILNKNYFSANDALSSRTAYGVTGKAGEVGSSIVDSLFWENMYFSGLEANILDLSHIESTKNIRLLGIIGYQVFSDYEIFIDFQNLQIILTRLDKRGARLDTFAIYERAYDSLDFTLHKHMIMIKAEVEGVTLRVNLDTGAELNLLDRRVKKKVLEHFKILKRVQLVGTGNREVEVLAGILYNLNCGNQTNPGMNTLLTSLDELSREHKLELDGVIGFEFLSQRRTLINYKKKKLYFFKPLRP